MNINKFSTLTACIILSTYCATSVYAKAPESCFQSEFDYLIYEKNGDKAPTIPTEKQIQHFIDLYGEESVRANHPLWFHGPARRKEIIINVKSSVANKMITLDASESKTPSGKIQFAWGDPFKPVSTDSHISSEGGDKPGSGSVPLTVKDPVCESSKSINATYTVQ